MPFAFYDFETTGAEPAFDQPLQFAAILTDDDFNELDRVNIRCRLAPHVLPSPMAMAITHVTPAMMLDQTLPSWFEFSGILRKQVEKWSPACWTGYNSIRFDEEVLRHTFYQNLQPEIFLTQLNGNQRMDMLRAVQSIRMLAPDVLSWPKADGKVSFKLDQLAPANGFAEHDAHDALGDVLATIHLAGLIRRGAPRLWDNLLANRNKKDVIARLQMGRPMVLVENHFGRLKIRRGCYCGVQDNYNSAAAFYDLESGEPGDLVDADDEAVKEALVGKRRRIFIVAANKDPSLFDLPAPSREFTERADLIANHPDFHRRVGAIMAKRYEDREEPEQVEKRIYSGFYSSNDKELLERFQKADPATRVSLLNEMSDERMRQLAHRLLLSQAPDFFPSEHVRKAARAIAERWKSEPVRNGWNTSEQARLDLKSVAENGLATEEQIDEMRRFLRVRIEQAEQGIMPG